MKIAVTHLTRMQRGYMCVAGVDVDTGEHVRPVLPQQRLSTDLCARRGGPFDMAVVVDLGLVRPVPSRPELEDHEFLPSNVRAVQPIDSQLFWDMLEYLAKPSLRQVFGPDLRRAGKESALMPLGRGRASLACLRPQGPPRLIEEVRPDGKPSLRLLFTDGDFVLNLSVTDLRLYHDDHVTLRRSEVQAVAEALARGVPAVLGVGLTRPYSSREGELPVHWLQVNNVHLEANPIRRLGSASAPHTRPVVANPDFEDLPF